MDNKRRILDIARKLFNSRGLKNVTARVICDELNISPGSFSYHFPDKRLIVKTLYEEMQAEFLAVLAGFQNSKVNIIFYLETHRKVFLIQNKYKFFYLNLFEILTNYEDVRKIYLKNVLQERQMAKEMIIFYIKQGVLKSEIDERTIERLINVGQILNNFWTVDAEIMPEKEDKHKLIHYLKICCGLLEPYLEAPSLKGYNTYFDNLEN